MHNEYKSLSLIKNCLNNCTPILKEINSATKQQFSNDANLIMLATGITSEIKNFLDYISLDFLALNKELSEIIIPIKKYCSSFINIYGFANTYRLYDFFKIDLSKLKEYLNKSIN